MNNNRNSFTRGIVLSISFIYWFLSQFSTVAAQENIQYNIQLPTDIAEVEGSKPVTHIQVPYRSDATAADNALHEQTDGVYYNSRLTPLDHQTLSDNFLERLINDGWQRCSTSYIDNPPQTQEHTTYLYKEVDRQGWSLFVNASNSLLETARGSGGSAEFPSLYLYRLQKSTLTCEKLQQRLLPHLVVDTNIYKPGITPSSVLVPANLKPAGQNLVPTVQIVHLTGSDKDYFEGAENVTTALYWSDKNQIVLRDELIAQYEAAGWMRCTQESDLTRFGKPAELVIFKKPSGQLYETVQLVTYEVPDHEKAGYYNWGPYGLVYYWYTTTGDCATLMPRVTFQKVPIQSKTAMQIDAISERLYEFLFSNTVLLSIIGLGVVVLLTIVQKRK